MMMVDRLLLQQTVLQRNTWKIWRWKKDKTKWKQEEEEEEDEEEEEEEEISQNIIILVQHIA